jgi:hypothetical protein
MCNAHWAMKSDFRRRQIMHLKKIALSVFLLCSFVATAAAQNQTIEYGSPDELKGVEKIFVDTGADMGVRDKIIAEVRKNLRSLKPELIIVSKPEESDFHLRFHYKMETLHGEGPSYPGGRHMPVPYGTVVKILSKDRVRLLMSYSFEKPNFVVGVSWGKRKHEVEFAREFAKAYLTANSQKQGQLPRLVSS